MSHGRSEHEIKLVMQRAALKGKMYNNYSGFARDSF